MSASADFAKGWSSVGVTLHATSNIFVVRLYFDRKAI